MDVWGVVQVVLAGCTLLFSVIVMGTTADRLDTVIVGDFSACYYTKFGASANPRSCDAAIGIGAVGLVAGIFATVLAVVELQGLEAVSFISSKPLLYVRGAVAGFLAFIWLVCFGIVVTDYNNDSFAKRNVLGSQSAAQAVSAFSFFSVIAWAALAVILIVFRGIRGGGDDSPAAPAKA